MPWIKKELRTTGRHYCDLPKLVDRKGNPLKTTVNGNIWECSACQTQWQVNRKSPGVYVFSNLGKFYSHNQ